MQRGFLAAVLVGVLAFSACGPHYTVYNGGLLEREDAQTSGRLHPTEAIVVYKSDYADPETNQVSGVPTNRVATRVPTGMVDHDYVSLSTADGVVRVSQVLPVDGRTGPSSVSATADSLPAQALSSPHLSAKLSEPYQGMTLATGVGVTVDSELDKSSVETEFESTTLAADSSALQRQKTTGDAVAIGHVRVLKQPVAVSVPLHMELIDQTARYEDTHAKQLIAGADTIRLEADTLVAGARSDAPAAKGVIGLDVPVAATGSEERVEYATTNAPIVRKDPAAVQDLTGGGSGKLLAHREAPRFIERSDANISAAYVDGLAVSEQRRRPRTLTDSSALEQDVSADAVAAKEQYANLLGIEDAEALKFAADPRATMRALVSNAVTTKFEAEALKEIGDSLVTTEAVMVSPPWLSVLLQGKLIGPAEVAKLVKSGVLPHKPRSPSVIRYRIYCFNGSQSKAKSVRLVNRLHEKTPIIATVVPEGAVARHDKATGTLYVVLEELQPQQVFVADYYVELSR